MNRPEGNCAACGHAGGLHYGPEGVCVADCRSLSPLVQCGCAKFVTQVGSTPMVEGEASTDNEQERSEKENQLLALPRPSGATWEPE